MSRKSLCGTIVQDTCLLARMRDLTIVDTSGNFAAVSLSEYGGHKMKFRNMVKLLGLLPLDSHHPRAKADSNEGGPERKIL